MANFITPCSNKIRHFNFNEPKTLLIEIFRRSKWSKKSRISLPENVSFLHQFFLLDWLPAKVDFLIEYIEFTRKGQVSEGRPRRKFGVKRQTRKTRCNVYIVTFLFFAACSYLISWVAQISNFRVSPYISVLTFTYFQKPGNNGAHIGLRDFNGDGTYENVDGYPVTYTNWYGGSVSNTLSNKPDTNGCAFIGGAGWGNTWFGRKCDIALHCYACQKGIKIRAKFLIANLYRNLHIICIYHFSHMP